MSFFSLFFLLEFVKTYELLQAPANELTAVAIDPITDFGQRLEHFFRQPKSG